MLRGAAVPLVTVVVASIVVELPGSVDVFAPGMGTLQLRNNAVIVKRRTVLASTLMCFTILTHSLVSLIML